MPRWIYGISWLLCCLVAVAPVMALVQPDRSSAVAQKAYLHPDFVIDNAYRQLEAVPANEASLGYRDLARMSLAAEQAFLDPRGGRWGTLFPTEPLLPGDGVGNALTWEDLERSSPGDLAELEVAAWDAFHSYLYEHREALRLDLSEVSSEPNVVAHEKGDLIQIYAPRVKDGMRVEGSSLQAVIGHGNLILFGAQNWGDIEVSTRPTITRQAASEALRSYLAPSRASGEWGAVELLLLPTARGKSPERVEIGRGYGHRLVWSLRPDFEEELGRWEARIDAHSGKVLSFQDTNHYADATREVKGGVLPVSNDGVPPDGVEQPGWPMPFDEINVFGGPVVSDSGGNLPSTISGTATSSLDGLYVRINDGCGGIHLNSAGNLDYGASGGTDCATPGFGGAGNTHAARSAFYELNRTIEAARARLPRNAWLQSELEVNTNTAPRCNACWNGAVNLYSSSCCRFGVPCGNSGEQAAIVDHEWGHGMDDNDVRSGVSNPAEGIADLYAALRLNTSCIGRGYTAVNCTGYGDPCTSCTGLRDIDWARRLSGVPHDVTWSMRAGCGSDHCRGAVYAEAVWDLYTRDLPSKFGMDGNTALEVTTRLTFLGAGLVGNWFQNTAPFGGCNGGGGYLNFLAVDDDNGSLVDGTPHLEAIFTAFDRHGAACLQPSTSTQGCVGTPGVAPTVTATASDKGVGLSWSAVPGASEYEVYRADGVSACDIGKLKVADTTAAAFVDTGLQNGREYSYVVIPKGPAEPCFGPASACVTATPEECCKLPLGASELLVSAPSRLNVPNTDAAFCALRGTNHQQGFCYGFQDAASGGWDLAGFGDATCGYACIDQVGACPCPFFAKEVRLTKSTSKTFSRSQFTYCALGGEKHDPRSGSCWTDYDPVRDEWTLTSSKATCNFVCVSEAASCDIEILEVFVGGPNRRSVSDSDFSYCALGGIDHVDGSYCWSEHDVAAGVWNLDAVGNHASCNFLCIKR